MVLVTLKFLIKSLVSMGFKSSSAEVSEFISRKNALLGSFIMPTASGWGWGESVIDSFLIDSFTLARMSASNDLTMS